ncbi:MAG: sugar phosphate isomerase/epimerase family protein [Cyclobacteriaceae bacterium]
MIHFQTGRRRSLKNIVAGIGALSVGALVGCTKSSTLKQQDNKGHKFRFCLNASTIRGQKLGLMREMEIASEAGYDGIEIWIQSLQQFINEGGTAAEVKEKATKLQLKLEGAIGFAQWIVDDQETRKKAMEQAAKEMELLQSIGCFRLAAPPAGAVRDVHIDLNDAAMRYKELLILAEKYEVQPLLELWGFSENLSKMAEVMYVATAAGHPNAAILADVYHLFKGDSSIQSLKLLDGNVLPVFHMNDYPASLEREIIADKDRIMPGDGVAPIHEILKILHQKQTEIVLSVELFSEKYWQQDPLQVAKEGLAKMQSVVQTIIS